MLFAEAVVNHATLIALLTTLVAATVAAITSFGIAKLNFNYRIKFEKEYDKYERLWKAFFECRKGLADLAPSITLGPPTSRESIATVYNEFQRAVRFEEPFICEEVYQSARRALSLGSRMSGTHSPTIA